MSDSSLTVYHVVANRNGAWAVRFNDPLPKHCKPVTPESVRRLGLSEDLAKRTAIKANAENRASIINEAITRTGRKEKSRA